METNLFQKESIKLHKFKSILTKLMVSENGLVWKEEMLTIKLNVVNVAIKLREKIYWTGTYGTSPKPVSSITIDKVVQVLTKYLDTYNNPDIQISNNDSPFNRSLQKRSKQVQSQETDISLQTIRPHHPFSDPVENLIRPKQSYENENNEQELWTWMAFLDS